MRHSTESVKMNVVNKCHGLTGNERWSSGKQMFPGHLAPGSEWAKERKGQGTNWPASYWPIRSWERI